MTIKSVCPKCNNEITKEMKFCNNCGTEIKKRIKTENKNSFVSQQSISYELIKIIFNNLKKNPSMLIWIFAGIITLKLCSNSSKKTDISSNSHYSDENAFKMGQEFRFYVRGVGYYFTAFKENPTKENEKKYNEFVNKVLDFRSRFDSKYGQGESEKSYHYPISLRDIYEKEGANRYYNGRNYLGD